jgi:ATP-dependent RNA helicase DeaD
VLKPYRIDVGRLHGASPKEIVGAIANEGGIDGKFIGQIHLFDDYSMVELPADLPADIIATLKRTRVKQKPLNLRPLTDADQPMPAKRPRATAHQPRNAPTGKPPRSRRD